MAATSFFVVVYMFAIIGCHSLTRNKVSSLKIAEHFVDEDFEEGSTVRWNDESEGDVHWDIQEFESDASPPPAPSRGSKYLRLRRNATFGVAITRSQIFTAHRGDQIIFDYWIRSRFTHFNNLQVQNQTDQYVIEFYFSVFIAVMVVDW